MDDLNPQSKTDAQVQEEFTSYYLQRVTQEFAEDLDKIRNADDFKNDALPLLITALKQGAALFSPEEQRRIVTAEGPAADAAEVTDAMEEVTEATTKKADDSSEKKNKKHKKKDKK